MIAREGTFNNMPYLMERFDSIDEFITTVEGRKFQGKYSFTEPLRGEDYDRRAWRGASGYTEAKKQFMEGTKATAAMRTAYTALQTSRKRETVNAPCGGAPIVAAALMGLPNSMIDIRRKREPKTARVIINMGIRWQTTAEDITRAGKMIIAAVGKLDGEGISTEILCTCDSVVNDRAISSCGITIKTAGQAFNAARVSFSMSSPAFLRVFQFIHKATKPGLPYDPNYGCAVPYKLKGKTLDAYYQTMYGPGVYISLAEVAERGQAEIDRAISEWRRAGN